MPPPNPTGQPVPVTPQVPVTGGGLQNPSPQRQTAAQARQDQLQKIASSDNPIFRRVYHKTIKKGAAVTFQYLHWKHDPYPLILCSSIYGDGRVAGINMHYLTFKYIKYLISQYCDKQFSYPLIKGNSYIYNAFRTYKRDGVRMAKVLDCNFLATILGTVRSFKPSEIEAIRQEVQRQLRAKLNPTVDDLSREYMESIVPNPQHQRYSTVQGYEPLERFGEPEWPRSVPPLTQPKPTIGDARFLQDNLLPPS